ncbi:Hypothetical Protein FCC1311_055202 [Hondaea fermentalgiana]|uniref:Uncharacterized protein n=1 Tax=Hondaea fermentalgiana TaxID=2315210 RepID=A0A2R5GHV0_9STRA|nr:Hypothetical Protein FCC1311_055202 [Hondaea fermentalgiana]|eukprot:GBG29298.1 Hypothetical Protein FCC1311_055202 [Hondaea fermentalgiana]
MGLDAAIFRSKGQENALRDLVASEKARQPDHDEHEVETRVNDAVDLCERVRGLADECSKRRATIREQGEAIRKAMKERQRDTKREEGGDEAATARVAQEKTAYLKELKVELKAREKDLKEFQLQADIAVAQFGNVVEPDSVSVVSASRLDLAETCVYEILDRAGKVLGKVSNTTDYCSRALSIRSGAKRHLQVSKKFVHVVKVHLTVSEDYPLKACPSPLDLAPPPITQRLSVEAQHPHSFLKTWEGSLTVDKSACDAGLELLEFWLRRNSYVGGATLCAELESRARALVSLCHNSLCGIQYPAILRWLALMEKLHSN